jgi:predicted component of type VI protein secretion system
MKVQLIVVQGKPEGKVIPLTGPTFKIGRGETCHLRPNSEQVSREHAEFTISGDVVTVCDLGSRNGTLVNGKALTTETCQLKDRDLVQVGPLTFAVSIEKSAPGAAAAPAKPAPAAKAPSPAAPPQAKPAPAAPAPQAKAAPEDVSNDEIDSWLFGEGVGTAPDQPATVYGGDTITIAAFKDGGSAPSTPVKPPSVASDDEYERQEEEPGDEDDEAVAGNDDEVVFDKLDDDEDDDGDDEEEAPPEDEFVDESNPFYAAKKAQKELEKGGAKPGAGGANQQFKDTSDAANEILRKLREMKKASK